MVARSGVFSEFMGKNLTPKKSREIKSLGKSFKDLDKSSVAQNDLKLYCFNKKCDFAVYARRTD